MQSAMVASAGPPPSNRMPLHIHNHVSSCVSAPRFTNPCHVKVRCLSTLIPQLLTTCPRLELSRKFYQALASRMGLLVKAITSNNEIHAHHGLAYFCNPGFNGTACNMLKDIIFIKLFICSASIKVMSTVPGEWGERRWPPPHMHLHLGHTGAHEINAPFACHTRFTDTIQLFRIRLEVPQHILATEEFLALLMDNGAAPFNSTSATHNIADIPNGFFFIFLRKIVKFWPLDARKACVESLCNGGALRCIMQRNVWQRCAISELRTLY